MPAMRHMRIFMSFHHICLRTRFAPLRNPCADTARLSVLSCRESRRAPRSETLLMLSRMIPTVLSISLGERQQMSYGGVMRVFDTAQMSQQCGTARRHAAHLVSVAQELVRHARGRVASRQPVKCSAPELRPQMDHDDAIRTLAMCFAQRTAGWTYRLKCRSAVVAILALALLAARTTRWDVGIIWRVSRVGHDGRNNVFRAC